MGCYSVGRFEGFCLDVRSLIGEALYLGACCLGSVGAEAGEEAGGSGRLAVAPALAWGLFVGYLFFAGLVAACGVLDRGRCRADVQGGEASFRDVAIGGSCAAHRRMRWPPIRGTPIVVARLLVLLLFRLLLLLLLLLLFSSIESFQSLP